MKDMATLPANNFQTQFWSKKIPCQEQLHENGNIVLTLAMLNKLRCHAHILFSAN